MSTASPNVFVPQATGNYGSVSGQSTASNSSFQVRLLPGLTPFSTVAMTATLNYSGGPALSESREIAISIPTSQSVTNFDFATTCQIGGPISNPAVSNTASIVIPGTVATGIQPASLYPSPIAVAGLSGVISRVQ